MQDTIQKIAQQVYDEAGFKSTYIKDKKYSIQLLPASLGFQVGTSLIQILLPVLGAWADSKEREGFVLPEEEGLYSEIALLVCSQLEKVDLLNIIQVLLRELKVNGEKVDFDAHFRGNYSALLGIVEFAIRENFSDFLSGYLRMKGVILDSLNTPFQKNQTKQDQIQEK